MVSLEFYRNTEAPKKSEQRHFHFKTGSAGRSDQSAQGLIWLGLENLHRTATAHLGNLSLFVPVPCLTIVPVKNVLLGSSLNLSGFNICLWQGAEATLRT